MAANIKPGTDITVKIVNEPTNAAARKTLVRLLRKSDRVKAEDRRLTAIRKQDYSPERRGGRLYGGRVVKLHPVKGTIGEQETITATLDVLRDLASVERFVDVKSA
jgi:hypothetical protein